MTAKPATSARGGRDTIDHAPMAHDDVANAAAGVLVMVKAARGCTHYLHTYRRCVMLPEDLVAAIDRVATNRSRFLADAAMANLRERSNVDPAN